METIFYWVTKYGYIGIFSLLVLGIVGFPIPDELLLTFSGYLVFKGKLHPITTVAVAFLGSTCGITLSYGSGRIIGIYLIKKYGYIVHITADKINQVHRWFDHIGKWALTFGYFVPGIRHFTAYVAGTSDLRFPVFAIFAYTGSFIWSVTFISIGYFLGEEWDRVSKKIHFTLVIGSIIIVALLLFYLLLSQRKQRQK